MLLLILSLILGALILLVGWAIGVYNTLVTGDQDIKGAWSNIKTEYQRRADLFFNLVKTVKSYKKHEKDTLEIVTKARAGNFGRSFKEQNKNMNAMEDFFKKFLATFEAYPDLKSNEQHNKLMDEISISEDRINAARTEYNSIVEDFNTFRSMFPTYVLANLFNYQERDFFQSADYADKKPEIDL